jgi:soluble lytic murein transglycosylase
MVNTANIKVAIVRLSQNRFCNSLIIIFVALIFTANQSFSEDKKSSKTSQKKDYIKSIDINSKKATSNKSVVKKNDKKVATKKPTKTVGDLNRKKSKANSKDDKKPTKTVGHSKKKQDISSAHKSTKSNVEAENSAAKLSPKPEKIKPTYYSESAKHAANPITQKLWQGIENKDLENIKQVINSLEKKDYDSALKYAALVQNDDVKSNVEIGDKILSQPPQPNIATENQVQAPSKQAKSMKPSLSNAMQNIILWKKFSDNENNASFSDISRFVNDNPFYPNINDLRKNAEKIATTNKIPYRFSEQYFKSNPANTTESKLYLLQAKIDFLKSFKGSAAESEKFASEIQNSISEIWIKENFSLQAEQNFLKKYSSQLVEEVHISRVRRLLFDLKIEDAKRIFPFINDDYQKLFSATIEIQELPKYIDNIVLSVPRKLRDDELLSYRRILWYKNKDKADDLIDLLTKVSNTSYSGKWWGLRRLYAREMIKKHEFKIAYNLCKNHGLQKTSQDYWEAEWMAGWTALRFINKSEIAYQHFENLYNNVSQPVTLSRGAYWLGMAKQASGDTKKAIEWYKIATKYPVFFYGQLAIHKHRKLDSVNAADDIILPKDPDITIRDLKNISDSSAAKVAYILAITGDKASATKIFEYIISEAPTEGQVAVIMKIVNEIEDRAMDARLSRFAAKKNVFFIKDKFQIVKEVESDEYAPLVHAIIKQESGFAPTALSSVGAIGFMQLMPDTAKLVARDLGVPYNKQKLATDIKYNVQLGSFYIKQLIDKFDGSEMLAIASYNAGPGATQRWINEFYDPRKEKDLDKVIDWIELITYGETRNYVQRIMENLIVYKYLMSRACSQAFCINGTGSEVDANVVPIKK